MRFRARICEIESNKVVFSTCVLLCCRRCCCFDYSGWCYAQNTTHIVQCCPLFYFVVLFCRSRCVVPQSLFAFAFAFISLWMRVWVCAPAKLFCIYSIPICIWIWRKKSKTTNRKTSESIRKSCKQYFGVYEWLRARTHTHTERFIR